MSFALLCLILMSLALTPVFAQTGLAVNVETDKATYHLRENVNIDGNVTYDGIIANKTHTGLVESGLAGIEVSASGGAFIARTRPLGPNTGQTYMLQILLLTLSDQNGNPLQFAIRGNPAYFRVQVKNNGFSSRTPLITINVFDNDSTPMGLVSIAPTILPGEISDSWQRLDLQPWAKNGTAMIYANVYSDWPDDGGYPYCPEKAAYFAITESQYVESLPQQLSQPPVVNGTFHVSYKLGPDPYPTTYYVYATANYRGFTLTQPALTTYQVTDIAAPPRASFAIKPPRAAPNYTVTFDASSATAEGYNDNITAYKWTFGDGQTATGKIATHSYSTTGNKIVTLNVTDTEGFWNTTTRTAIIIVIHNIAVTSISSLNDIYNNWKVLVGVAVKNKGTMTETFNVTLTANGIHGGTTKVTSLAPYATSNIVINWNTTGLTPLVSYTISVHADNLPGESDTTDNTLTFGPIFVRLMGDVRYDRKIDILDVVAITSVYGLTSAETAWNIMADLVRDNVINILDVVKVTTQYGQRY